MTSALRPLTQEDLRAVHELFANPAVVRYMLIPLSASIGDSQQFLTDGLSNRAWQHACRTLRDDGGSRYLVGPRWQGRGIATQAVLQLLEFAFETLCLHCVFACCGPDKLPSAALRKVGMRHDRLRRWNLKIRGEWMNSAV